MLHTEQDWPPKANLFLFSVHRLIGLFGGWGQDIKIKNKNDIKIKIFLTIIDNSGFSSKIYSEYIY